MKKKFNWLELILISSYVVIFTLIIIAYVLDSEPMNSPWLFVAIIWGVALVVLIPFTHLSIMRYLLPLKKSHVIILLKELQKEQRWNDGYTISCKIPILVFQFDNGARKILRVPFKVYKSVQCGDAGTLFYKEEKKHTFFIDFVHD